MSNDLIFTREVAVTPEFIWRGWTDAEFLKKWFCPRPWRTTQCTIDLRPGGIFHTVMEGPDGEKHDSAGCFLEVVPTRRLVWTNALGPDYRPQPLAGGVDFPLTCVLTMEAKGGGKTLYTAVCLHKDAEDREKHNTMGFQEGWGLAFDQLLALA